MAHQKDDPSQQRLVSEVWWLWVIQAIVAILFGILAVFWPAPTLVAMVYLLSAFVFVIGLLETIRGLAHIRVSDTWWMTLIIGLILLGVGTFLARHPRESFATFILIVGITFIVWGVVRLVRSFLEIEPGSHRILDFIAGLAALVAGVLTLFQPVAGGLAFVWIWGLYALIQGIVSLMFAIGHYHDYKQLKESLA